MTAITQIRFGHLPRPEIVGPYSDWPRRKHRRPPVAAHPAAAAADRRTMKVAG